VFPWASLSTSDACRDGGLYRVRDFSHVLCCLEFVRVLVRGCDYDSCGSDDYFCLYCDFEYDCDCDHDCVDYDFDCDHETQNVNGDVLCRDEGGTARRKVADTSTGRSHKEARGGEDTESVPVLDRRDTVRKEEDIRNHCMVVVAADEREEAGEEEDSSEDCDFEFAWWGDPRRENCDTKSYSHRVDRHRNDRVHCPGTTPILDLVALRWHGRSHQNATCSRGPWKSQAEDVMDSAREAHRRLPHDNKEAAAAYRRRDTVADDRIRRDHRVHCDCTDPMEAGAEATRHTLPTEGAVGHSYSVRQAAVHDGSREVEVEAVERMEAGDREAEATAVAKNVWGILSLCRLSNTIYSILECREERIRHLLRS
jgi:hypothetical protein